MRRWVELAGRMLKTHIPAVKRRLEKGLTSDKAFMADFSTSLKYVTTQAGNYLRFPLQRNRIP